MRFVGGVVVLLAALAIAPAVAEDRKAGENPVETAFKAMSFQDKLADLDRFPDWREAAPRGVE